MAITITFTETGRAKSERYERAADALAKWSALLSPPTNKPLVYAVDDHGRDLSQEDLERLAIDEAGNAHRT